MTEINSKWQIVGRTNARRHFTISGTAGERLTLTKRAPNATKLHESIDKP